MNQTDFRPSVRLDSSCDKVTITAPRNTRERAWEILGYFYDEGIFDKTGGVPTQIFLKPHPGYDNDAVFSIAVTAVYLATVNKDLEYIWTTPFEVHKNLIANQGIITANFPPGDKWIDFVLKSYIVKQALKRLNGVYETGFKRLGYKMNVINGWINEVVSSYPHIKNKKISKKALAFLEYLDHALALAKDINESVAQAKLRADSMIKTFQERLEGKTFTGFDILTDAERLIRTLQNITDRIEILTAETKALHASFPDEDDIQTRLREIRLHTSPPAMIEDKK